MRFPFELKKNAEFDVVGFGTNAMDFLISVPHYPKFNSKVELIDYSQAAGGEVASTIVGLQRLGRRTTYIGRFGDDSAGKMGLESLRQEDVDLRFAETISGASTQIAFIIIDEISGERTVIWKRDAKLAYGTGDAPEAATESCRILHLTPHDVDASIMVAKRARASGAIVSVDIDDVFPRVDELLENVDLLFTSATLPPKMMGVSDAREALKKLQQRFRAAIVGLTLGENGSLALARDKFIRTDGFDVPGGCKDTTGAGDAFRAGLLHGVLADASVEKTMRIANAVAALKCRAIGARTSLPTPAELDDYLKIRSNPVKKD
ncbi:MAG: carbohydrate kinase family protein [Acidobacteria bacterium]|nr:carbohydrate kinase family protein [Acidobacteriota bacterium]MCA1608589.1 carbohydrate kinase family protein [Acidobacteriota bacterium]